MLRKLLKNTIPLKKFFLKILFKIHYILIQRDKKKIKKGINETVVISSVIAGLATWYIASSYFTNKQESDPNESVPVSVPDTGLKGGSRIVNSKVPHIESDDPTRSYNLIGSGLNIPRSELAIPNVLIDYK